VAITVRPVAGDPVNATLSTPARHSAWPVVPSPVATWKTGGPATASAKVSARKQPTAGVSSLGLRTTALPAARA
jgi:hypothetical protein